jgi:hypothetical protein
VAKAAAVAEDVHPAAAVKVVVGKEEEEAAVVLVAAAVKVVEDKVVAVAVAVRPEAVGAADPVNNYKSSGASLFGGAPFFY